MNSITRPVTEATLRHVGNLVARWLEVKRRQLVAMEQWAATARNSPFYPLRDHAAGLVLGKLLDIEQELIQILEATVGPAPACIVVGGRYVVSSVADACEPCVAVIDLEKAKAMASDPATATPRPRPGRPATPAAE